MVGEKKMLVYDDVSTHEKVKIFDKKIEAPPHYDSFAVEAEGGLQDSIFMAGTHHLSWRFGHSHDRSPDLACANSGDANGAVTRSAVGPDSEPRSVPRWKPSGEESGHDSGQYVA